MSFTEKWYRLLVRGFPETKTNDRQAEILTTLEDSGHMTATIPSPRESVSLIRGGYKARVHTHGDPLKGQVITGIVLGAVTFLGYVWIRHIIALIHVWDPLHKVGISDWTIAAIPLILVLAASPWRMLRIVIVAGVAGMLIASADLSISDVAGSINRTWVPDDLYRILRFALPLAVVALGSGRVRTATGPAVAFGAGALVAAVASPGGSMTLETLTLRGGPVLKAVAVLAAIAVFVSIVITPVPLLAAASAATFATMVWTITKGAASAAVISAATAWIGVFGLVFAARHGKRSSMYGSSGASPQ